MTRVEDLEGADLNPNLPYDEKQAARLMLQYINPNTERGPFLRRYINWLSSEHNVEGFDDSKFDEINVGTFGKVLRMRFLDHFDFTKAAKTLSQENLSSLERRVISELEEEQGFKFTSKLNELNRQASNLEGDEKEKVLEQIDELEQFRDTKVQEIIEGSAQDLRDAAENANEEQRSVTFEDILDNNARKLYASFDPLDEDYKRRYSVPRTGLYDEKTALPPVGRTKEGFDPRSAVARRRTMVGTPTMKPEEKLQITDENKSPTVEDWIKDRTNNLRFRSITIDPWDIGKIYYPGHTLLERENSMIVNDSITLGEILPLAGQAKINMKKYSNNIASKIQYFEGRASSLLQRREELPNSLLEYVDFLIELYQQRRREVQDMFKSGDYQGELSRKLLELGDETENVIEDIEDADENIKYVSSTIRGLRRRLGNLDTLEVDDEEMEVPGFDEYNALLENLRKAPTDANRRKIENFLENYVDEATEDPKFKDKILTKLLESPALNPRYVGELTISMNESMTKFVLKLIAPQEIEPTLSTNIRRQTVDERSREKSSRTFGTRLAGRGARNEILEPALISMINITRTRLAALNALFESSLYQEEE